MPQIYFNPEQQINVYKPYMEEDQSKEEIDLEWKEGQLIEEVNLEEEKLTEELPDEEDLEIKYFGLGPYRQSGKFLKIVGKAHFPIIFSLIKSYKKGFLERCLKSV